MSNPTLRFLTNEAGQKEGLGHSGIESFRDSPYASCAREAGQNSRDAALALPVRMTFNVLNIERDCLPSRQLLEEALMSCLDQAAQQREKDFFNNALSVIRKDRIPVLEIADYNTKGLMGPPDEEGTAFHSLVKSEGVTAEKDSHSGGSFGIGKNASLAVSDLRTVFYSTAWKESETSQKPFAAQGKVKLVSHIGRDGTKLLATGYWGDPNGFRAVTERASVPDWMYRVERGTSIFSIGFRVAEDWAWRMAFSLISNFFCAIHREEMVFEVDDGNIQINRNTVENLLACPDVSDAAESAGHRSDLVFAQQLYRCLVSDNVEEEILTIEGLGKMRVRVLIEEGMPRRIGFIRNGMFITDNLGNFGQPLARFPGSRDFVVLVEPMGNCESAFLKQLENPTHSGFSAERIVDPEKSGAAKRAMWQLGKELRRVIKSTTGVKHDGALVLDELGRFFADSGQGDVPPDRKAESDPERYVYESQRRSQAKRRSAMDPSGGRHGGSSQTGRGRGGKGGGSGRGAGGGSGGRGKRGERTLVMLQDVRNRIAPSDSGAPVSREIYFTPEADGSISLSIEATGIDTPEALRISGADVGTVDSGALTLDVKARERKSVVVTFSEAYSGPIELVAVATSEPTEGAK